VTTDIAIIAAAVSPDILKPRKCVGCKQTDLSLCGPCYRALYPRSKDTSPYQGTRAQKRARVVVRHSELITFVTAFHAETGYGVSMEWIIILADRIVSLNGYTQRCQGRFRSGQSLIEPLILGIDNLTELS
jgi:hypothetical protein